MTFLTSIINIKIKHVAFVITCLYFTTNLTAQSYQDALKYDISIDSRQIFTNQIYANASIKIRKENNDSIITFDLKGFTVDSVAVNGLMTTFQKSDSTLLVTIPFNTIINDTVDVAIYYRGQGQKDALWGGYYLVGTYAFNMGVGFDSKPHNFGRAWFPCFDNFTDRALYKLQITTLPDYTAVCGGILTNDTVYADNSTKWTWELNQPIPTYLASFAIGKYTFIKYNFNAKNGNLPIWIAVEPKDTAKARQSFLRLNDAIACFEEKFGAYQFDRVGFVGVPFNAGAMEHATNIAYPLYAIDGTANYETLMAHELSHHWWGNLATCENAEEMWLNEGWASFCEALFLECAYGKPFYQKDMQDKLIDVMINAPANDNGYIAVNGVSHQQTYGTTVYKKGALMVNNLRAFMGDSAFFAACKSYLTKYKFKEVNSIKLRDEFQLFTSKDLTFFFNQYIFTKGHYDVIIFSSNNLGSEVTLQLMELNKFKTQKHDSMLVIVTTYFTDRTTQKNMVTLVNGEGIATINTPTSKVINYFVVDEETTYALGHTSDTRTINNTGLTNFDNSLLSINTQTITDSVLINVQHHWVGASVGNLRNLGIRISTDRYWSIRGKFPTAFSAWAYFNYNGTSQNYYDEDFFKNVTNEDSLVLLHRINENKEWRIIPPADVAYQPGGNPTDKLGRFWLNKLLPGDYAIGNKDKSVVGLTEVDNQQNKIKITPNPTSEELTITLPINQSFTKSTITIIDNNGKELLNQKVDDNKNEFTINVKKLTAGVYTVIVKTANKSDNIRFIKL